MRIIHRLFLLSLIGYQSLAAHETFLIPESFQIESDAPLKIHLFTGTFEKSFFPLPDTAVKSLTLQGPSQVSDLSTNSWISANPNSLTWKVWQKAAGMLGGVDFNKTSHFEVKPADEGTWAIGYE